MSAIIAHIEKAGFSIEIDDGDLIVSPATLSERQIAFLHNHKPEIVEALRVRALEASAAGADLNPANDERHGYTMPGDLAILAIPCDGELKIGVKHPLDYAVFHSKRKSAWLKDDDSYWPTRS